MKAAPACAALGNALGLFGTGLSQQARLITLTSSQDGGLPEALAVEGFSGREAVNELFLFEIDARSTSTDLDLALFIGEALTLGLLQPDGSRRYWHGLCTAASWLGADGGVARYRLRLEPALAMLALRRDSYIFQDKNVCDIACELLADYPQVHVDFDVTQELLPRAICTQYRESDLDFFTRLLASEGLNWRFEHEGTEVGGHRLLIFDSRAAPPSTPGGEVLRFHGVRATEKDDAIDGFRARRSIQGNSVTISSWDPALVMAPGNGYDSSLDAGALPRMAVYDGSGERIFSRRSAAEAHSELMLQALELGNKVFEGSGAVRRLAAAHAFHLSQHDRYQEGANVFKVLWVRHEARNNFQTGIAGPPGSPVENGTYRNVFACVRAPVPLVPALTAQPQRITAPGAQCALVVGLADAVATSNRDHQVRVQFPWQRGARPNAGGMAHNLDPKGCAPGNERSGTWVRVAEALAGPNWGTVFTPRIGTEVLVDFVEGDIDRPVIVGQLYNGSDFPPFSAGVDAGVNHAGVLSGIHTRNFDGRGYNQWQIDDSTGQLRMRLATSFGATQLNLGYLIHQEPGTAQRGAYRGSGFELRTDAWAVIRGGEGVLLSTRARPALGSGVTSTQMDVAEALAQFKSSAELAGRLGEVAQQQGALFSQEAAQAQCDFIAQIDPQAKGRYEGPVNGQAAFKAKPGSRELDTTQPVEKFGMPIVLMDAAASINWATPASTVLFAGKHLHWTTQSDIHMTAGHTFSSVSGGATSFFTHSGGIQAIAANGPVSLQAHTDALDILADKEITVISVNDCIEIKAKQKIVLQAGKSSITLEGGDVTFACPGKFSVKGGQHIFDKGERVRTELTPLPKGEARRVEIGMDMAHRAYLNTLYPGAFSKLATPQEELGAIQKTPPAWVDDTGVLVHQPQLTPPVVPTAWTSTVKDPARGKHPLDDAHTTFSTIQALTLPPGTTIYRIVDPTSLDNSICWMSESEFKSLASKDEWRRRLAVWAHWNGNGEFITYTVPEGAGLNVWEGVTASQQLGASNYVLEGGARQIVVNPADLQDAYISRRQVTTWGYDDFDLKNTLDGVPVQQNNWRQN